ncbi:MAG: insulinase family protein, partial [Sphingomonadales bacterium]
LDEKQRPAAEKDAWSNPVAMPKWASVPAAVRTPLTLAPEAERENPPVPTAAVPVTPPAIADTRLDNGLQLVVARTGEVPLATMALVIKGGGATDPKGRAGLSDMTASIATRGTATRSQKQIAAEMEALGASLSTSAGADGTIISVTAPVATLEAAGRILVDIVRNASFPAEEFDRERGQSLDKLSVALKDPGTLSALALRRVIYGDAPYGAVTTPETLRAMTRDELVAQRDRWWRPDNAALIVTGGVDREQAAAMGNRLFSGWQSIGPAAIAPALRAGTAQAPRLIVIDMPGAGQAAVATAVRAVDRNDPAYPDLLVANAVLGSGSNGRLFQEIRTKRALSYGANSALAARADDGMLIAASQTKNESAPEVVAIFLAEFDKLAREPLDAETVGQRKAYLSGAVSRQAETSGGFAIILAGLVQQGLPSAEAARLVERIAAVTPEAASAAAAANTPSARASVVVVGDAKLFIDKLRAAHPQVEVIGIDSLDLNRPQLRK